MQDQGQIGRADRAQHRARPLWWWPAVVGVATAALVEALCAVDLPAGSWVPRALWPGDADAASALVQTVATAVITVTTMTFSITVVALQLASQQFSPRLLREFTRDPVTRVVLSVLVAAFVGALVTQRHLRTDTAPPSLATAGVLLLGVAALASVLVFITHVVRILRVDSMMRTVHRETDDAMDMFYPSIDRPEDPRDADDRVALEERLAREGVLVTADVGGFVRLVDTATLTEAVAEVDGAARVVVRPGDHLARGTPVAEVWAPTRDGVDDLERAIRRDVVLDWERTLEQDPAYGFRQLEDIAVRALSPGVNDPVTAAHAVGHMADLLVQLVGCRLGPMLHRDDRGRARLVMADRDLRYYLDLACGQLRRYAAREPSVLVALLRLLRDTAAAARTDDQREEVRRQAGLVRESVADGLLDADVDPVDDMVRRVELALAGDLRAAYEDRAGETRSL